MRKVYPTGATWDFWDSLRNVSKSSFLRTTSESSVLRDCSAARLATVCVGPGKPAALGEGSALDTPERETRGVDILETGEGL